MFAAPITICPTLVNPFPEKLANDPAVFVTNVASPTFIDPVEPFPIVRAFVDALCTERVPVAIPLAKATSPFTTSLCCGVVVPIPKLP